MKTIRDSRELQQLCLAARCQGRTVALVPTMGCFHNGHLALMDEARAQAGKDGLVVVSLFVNPTQFGPDEDLAAYPRDEARDAALAAARGVDVLFAPAPRHVYADGHATWVEVPDLARGLCGQSRPVHFRGVATVVTKLLTLALPHVAVFGQKDWQQLAIIRRLATDLNLPVNIVGHPIVREADGLAMSSRNAYLTTAERAQAPAIRAGLQKLRILGREQKAGTLTAGALKTAFCEHLAAHAPAATLDYLEIVHPDTLEPLATVADPALAAAAVHLGKARLIDNIILF